MSANPDFDRWYAAKSARFVLEPTHTLETFGNTLVNYHLISELPDTPGKVRIREGRLEAHQPQVILPHLTPPDMEGFGPEARAYFEFLRDHEDDLRILRYGFQLKRDNYSEQIVTDSVEAVVERVKMTVIAGNDGFAAVIVGVDDPWDVALIELWRREVERSAQTNINELQKSGRLFGKKD